MSWRPRYPMRYAMAAIVLWPPAAVLFAAGVTLVIVVPVTVIGGVGIGLLVGWIFLLTEYPLFGWFRIYLQL